MASLSARRARWQDPVVFAREGLGLNLSARERAILRAVAAGQQPTTRSQHRLRTKLVLKIERAMLAKGATIDPGQSIRIRGWHPAWWLALGARIVANLSARFSAWLSPKALKVEANRGR